MQRTRSFCLAAALLLLGCSEESARSGDAATGDAGGVDAPVADGGHDGAKATILDENHAGWKQPVCGACHNLPEKGHTADTPPQCAACHGANGACKPNGAYSPKQDHQQTDSCTSCHAQQHGFDKPADCASCHFAAVGIVDCPDAATDGGGPKPDGGPADSGGQPPVLSTALKHNCYNWPAQEFTPTNKAPWITSLKTGQLAVELTLKDTTGKSYTLSQLLADKPVWLQLGSFT